MGIVICFSLISFLLGLVEPNCVWSELWPVQYKSTTSFVFTLGGTAISLASNLQKIVVLSST